MARASTKKKEPQQQDDRPAGGVPLFEEVSDDWSYLAIERLEPLEEKGYLGTLPVDSDQEAIRAQFGGGKFMVRAKTSGHQVKNQRTVEIAGAPIFTTDEAEERYQRRQGAPRLGGRAAAAAPPAIGLTEILTLMQTMQAQAGQQLAQQLEAQRQERQRQAEEDRRREDMRREEDRRRDEDRRREEERREERRREEDARREAAQRQELEQARARDREHVQTILSVVTSNQKQQGDPTQSLLQGLTLGLRLKGEGGDDDDDDGEEKEPEDPLRATVRAAIEGVAEALGKGKQANGSSSPGPAAAGAAEDVRLTGSLGEQVKHLVAKAKERGQDPEKLLAGAVDVLDRKLDKAPKKAAAPAPAPAAPSSSGATVTDLAKARASAAQKITAAAAATHPEASPPADPPAS